MEFEEWWNETTEEEQFGEQEQTERLRDYAWQLLENCQYQKFNPKRVIIISNQIHEADYMGLQLLVNDLKQLQIDPIHENGRFTQKLYNEKYKKQ